MNKLMYFCFLSLFSTRSQCLDTRAITAQMKVKPRHPETIISRLTVILEITLYIESIDEMLILSDTHKTLHAIRTKVFRIQPFRNCIFKKFSAIRLFGGVCVLCDTHTHTHHGSISHIDGKLRAGCVRAAINYYLIKKDCICFFSQHRNISMEFATKK